MEKALLHRWLFFRKEPQRYTVAFGPYSWFGGLDLLHRRRTVGIISRYRFLPGASSTVAKPYLGFC
jgi:hypothetical protein